MTIILNGMKKLAMWYDKTLSGSKWITSTISVTTMFGVGDYIS